MHTCIESVLEAGYVAYMPGVYKMPMMRMFSLRTDESANVRVYMWNA